MLSRTCEFTLAVCLDTILMKLPTQKHLSQEEVAKQLGMSLDELNSFVALLTNNQFTIETLRQLSQEILVNFVNQHLAQHLQSYPTFTIHAELIHDMAPVNSFTPESTATVSHQFQAASLIPEEAIPEKAGNQGKKRKHSDESSENEQKRKRVSASNRDVNPEDVNPEAYLLQPIKPNSNNNSGKASASSSSASSSSSNASTVENRPKYIILNGLEKATFRTLEMLYHFSIPFPSQQDLAVAFLNVTVNKTKYALEKLVEHGVITTSTANTIKNNKKIIAFTKNSFNRKESFYDISEAVDLFNTAFKDNFENFPNLKNDYIKHCINNNSERFGGSEELQRSIESKIKEHKDYVSSLQISGTGNQARYNFLRLKILKSLLAYTYKQNPSVTIREVTEGLADKTENKTVMNAIDGFMVHKKLIDSFYPESLAPGKKRVKLSENFTLEMAYGVFKLTNETFEKFLKKFTTPQQPPDLFSKTALADKENFEKFLKHLEKNTLKTWDGPHPIDPTPDHPIDPTPDPDPQNNLELITDEDIMGLFNDSEGLSPSFYASSSSPVLFTPESRIEINNRPTTPKQNPKV